MTYQATDKHSTARGDIGPFDILLWVLLAQTLWLMRERRGMNIFTFKGAIVHPSDSLGRLGHNQFTTAVLEAQ